MAVIPYIQAARAGRNDAWRWVMTFFLVTLLVLFGSVVPPRLMQLDQAVEVLLTNLIPPSLFLALELVPYVFIPIGLWFGLSQLHHRSFYSLISANWSFHWRRFFLSAGLWLLLLALSDLFLAWRVPGRYALTFDAAEFFPYLVVALLLVPIQAVGEELLYRGYLAQGFGLAGGFWFAWLAPSLLFSLLHYQSAQSWMQIVPVIGISLLLGWLTLRSGGLELAIGLHLVNNFYAVVLVASEGSPLSTSAVFTSRSASSLVYSGSTSSELSVPLVEMVGGWVSLDLLVFLVASLLYLVLIALLGRSFFPIGLFRWSMRRLNRMTQPRVLQALAAVLGLLALLSSTGCLPSSRTASPTAEPGSGLALQDCFLGSGSRQVKAKCGKIAVPEDPDNEDGKQIELNLAVIPSISREPAPDPLFLLAGGPGQAATEAFLPFLSALERIRFKRDLVMVDQRGTGGSNPLSCPEEEAEGKPQDRPKDDEEVLGVELPLEEQLAEIGKCRDALGIDPRLYGTDVAMRDLDQVREALGYDQVNLLGVSYGTRAALAYLRLYPERVRTLILDGVVPPNTALGSTVAADAQHALDLIFTRCAQDAACQEAFPTLEDDFSSLMAALEEEPVEVTIAHPVSGQPVRVLVSPDTLGATVRLMSYNDLTTALLPLGIHEAVGGDHKLLASLYLQVVDDLSSGINMGMNQSVICREDAPLLEQAEVEGDFYLESPVEDLLAYCEVWAPITDPPVPVPPQTWDTPALLISGEADPVTPPENGEKTTAWLPNSAHLVLPGMGHSNFYAGCMPEILLRFLDQAAVDSLDSGCIETVQPIPFFLSPAGPQP